MIANQRSTAQRRFRVVATVLVTIAILASAAAYYYFRRDEPIRTLIVATGLPGSDSHELMEQVADVVARQSDRLRLKVAATGDSSRNIAVLNARRADLATIRADTPVVADVRMIADLFPDFFQLIVRQDSNIRFIRNLRGKRLAIPPFGTNEFRSFWVIADHYDLPIDGIGWQAISFSRASELLLSRKIDAIFTVRSLRDRLLLNMHEDAKLKDIPLRLVEVDQAPAIAVKRPFLDSNIIPKGAFGGTPPLPSRDTLSSTVIRTLVTREDVDADLISELTAVLFEHRMDLVIRFALASGIQQPGGSRGLSVPLHDGAERYYQRDEPSFLQENAEPIALMITIAAMLFSGLLALKSRLSTGQKNRMDSYNYTLLEIADQARNADTVDELHLLKQELYQTLETVVRALDTDEVTEEGFQTFSLLWESVREGINDRHGELTMR